MALDDVQCLLLAVAERRALDVALRIVTGDLLVDGIERSSGNVTLNV